MMKNYVAPILALSLICLVLAGILALVNEVTYPEIIAGRNERAERARREIFTDDEDFIIYFGENLVSLLDVPAERNAPRVLEAHRAADENGNVLGYAFIVSSRGFGDSPMQIMVGVCPNRRVIASSVLAQTESPGYADRVRAVAAAAEADGRWLTEADAVSGATSTFNAYRNALETALSAFDTIGGLDYE